MNKCDQCGSNEAKVNLKMYVYGTVLMSFFWCARTVPVYNLRAFSVIPGTFTIQRKGNVSESTKMNFELQKGFYVQNGVEKSFLRAIFATLVK
jgi:hypothetical protein